MDCGGRSVHLVPEEHRWGKNLAVTNRAEFHLTQQSEEASVDSEKEVWCADMQLGPGLCLV